MRILNESELQLVRAAFDVDYYLANNPDVTGDNDPFDHYMRWGWREGRDPNDRFRTSEYLGFYRDVAEAEEHPFVHYVLHGASEGRFSAPLSELRSRLSAEFDSGYYLRRYDDVAVSDMDPLDHYILIGWREGRDPNASFSTSDYLDMYEDVVEASLHPFFHYLEHGRAEGRLAKRQRETRPDFRATILASQRTLPERVALVRESFARPQLLPSEDLVDKLATFRTGVRGLHVTISHDDYTVSLGGVQLSLRRERLAFGDEGFDSVHLFPWFPLPCTDLDGDDHAVGVLLNEHPAGTYRASDVARALRSIPAWQGETRVLAIHSLHGHSTRALELLIEALAIDRAYYWIHDYHAVCTGWNLMRNDIEFCGAPPPDSPACSLCTYGDTRRLQAELCGKLLAGIGATVVAPAAGTLALWKSGAAFEPADELVISHCELVPRKISPMPESHSELRVAFLGLPQSHKGWATFRAIATDFEKDNRYRFYHLGLSQDKQLAASFRRVEASAQERNGMIEAIEHDAIDVALVWSLCPETFGLTAHEALAAGAAIVTNPDSGNIAALAARFAPRGSALVLPSEQALVAAFSSGSIEALARSRRTVDTFDLRFSRLTADAALVTR